uniref:DUF4585 domain-containing protein n=1 Tax=Seriola lalandi dorsalis TaxID=1841481 RepID=A0A3B4Y9K1_SERLL
IGGHRKHSDGGYSDTSSGGSFLDETDREVSTLTDRAFRSLCIGDEAVYNDSDLCSSSPCSQRDRQLAFSQSGQDRDRDDTEREELKRAAHESFTLRVQQYGQDWIHGGMYGAEIHRDPQWEVYGERTQGRVSATFQHSFVETSQQEKSLREEQLSFLSNGATELSSQQRRSRSRVSSLIRAFNSEGHRDGAGMDGKVREWNDDTSWDKSALMSIQQELSEFSTSYQQNFNSDHFPSSGPFSSRDTSFYSSEVAAVAHMNSASSFMSSSHSKHSMSTQVNCNSNFFIHSEFSPFKVWRDHNRFPFQQGEVSGFMHCSQFPKWYETPMYKELSLEAQPQGHYRLEERDIRHPRNKLAPVGPPTPPRSTSTSTMLQKAAAVEKRCESELIGHYPHRKRTQSLGTNRLPSQRPSTASPTIEMSRRVRDTISSVKALHQKIKMMTEQNVATAMAANQQGVLHSNDNLIPFGNNAVSVAPNVVRSNTSTTAFNISQLLTPSVHAHQEAETSEVRQYAVSPQPVEHPPVRAESRGATPDVRLSSYKSRATSLLFNLKDNRKRVKNTYSPTKFKGLEKPEKNKPPSIKEPKDTIIDIPDLPDPDIQFTHVEESTRTDVASHHYANQHQNPGLSLATLNSQPATAHTGQHSQYTLSDYQKAQMQGEMVHHSRFTGFIPENYTTNQLANGQNLREDLLAKLRREEERMKENEERKRLKQQEEERVVLEEQRRKAAQEEQQRRAAQEEKQRRAALQEQQRRAAFEEQQRRAAQEEQQRRATEEEQQRRAAQEEQQRRAVKEEQQMRAAEEEQQRRAAQEEQQRRAVKEEQQKRAAQEEQQRRAVKEEQQKRAALQEQQKRAALQEQQRQAKQIEEKLLAEIEEEKKRALRKVEERKAAEKEKTIIKQREEKQAKEERTRLLEESKAALKEDKKRVTQEQLLAQREDDIMAKKRENEDEEKFAAQREKERATKMEEQKKAAQRIDALQYYAITSTESERKPKERQLCSPLPSQQRNNPSGLEESGSHTRLYRPRSSASPAPSLPRSNTSSPALGAKPSMFRVKDNTIRGSSLTKSVKPRFHKNFGEDFRVGSPMERLSERVEEEQEMRHNDTGLNRLAAIKEFSTFQPASSSQDYAAHLPQHRPYSRRSIVLDEDDSRSVISNMSEDVESFATSAADLADLRGLFDYDRPESACSFSSDVSRSLGKPPAVPPKSEKALRRAKRLTTRRIKKELCKSAADTPAGVEKPLEEVPSTPPSSSTEVCSPNHHAVYHVETSYPQSYPLTQRKVLQDLGSGQYFVVDVPVQVKTKTFFDPETGKYVQLNVRESGQSTSRPQSRQKYPQPQLQSQKPCLSSLACPIKQQASYHWDSLTTTARDKPMPLCPAARQGEVPAHTRTSTST